MYAKQQTAHGGGDGEAIENAGMHFETALMQMESISCKSSRRGHSGGFSASFGWCGGGESGANNKPNKQAKVNRRTDQPPAQSTKAPLPPRPAAKAARPKASSQPSYELEMSEASDEDEEEGMDVPSEPETPATVSAGKKADKKKTVKPVGSVTLKGLLEIVYQEHPEEGEEPALPNLGVVEDVLPALAAASRKNGAAHDVLADQAASSKKRAGGAAQLDTGGPRKKARNGWGRGSSKVSRAATAHRLTWGDGKPKLNGSGRFKKSAQHATLDN